MKNQFTLMIFAVLFAGSALGSERRACEQARRSVASAMP